MLTLRHGTTALAGLLTASLPLVQAIPRTSPPPGCLVVNPSGAAAGEYRTFGAAISALGDGRDAKCIFLGPGRYEQQVLIKYKGKLTVYGYTTDTSSYHKNTVTVTHSMSAKEAGDDGKSSTIQVESADFSMYNVNVENTFGRGDGKTSQVQALALSAIGDRQGYYGCSFKGYQDTLYVKSGYQYYSKCYIEGAVDYIFGSASAWFDACTIVSNGPGYITASGRETAADPFWIVIDHSTVRGVSNDLAGKVYLGRPWGHAARVIYQNSDLGDVVNAEGWTTMTDGAVPTFEEYKNFGAGAATNRRKYSKAVAAPVTKAQLWPRGDGWYDAGY